MKLAVHTTAPQGAVIDDLSGTTPKPSFEACRELLRHQSDPIARRLGRLITRAETSLRRDAPDRFTRARRLEESVCYVAALRASHPESQALQRCVARLLRESFDSFDWRAPFISGLRPCENDA